MLITHRLFKLLLFFQSLKGDYQSLHLLELEESPSVSFGWTRPSEKGSVLRFNIYIYILNYFRRNVSGKNESYCNSFSPLINRHFHIIIIFKLHAFAQHFTLYKLLLQSLAKH